MSEQTIYSVDAICGAGKTFGAISYAIDAAFYDDAHIAIIQPSRTLIKQTEAGIRDQLSKMGEVVNVKAIYSDPGDWTDDDESVCSQIERFLDQSTNNPTGQILLITHAAFLSLPYWHNKESWEIIIDEIPSVVPAHSHKMEENSDLLKAIADVQMDADNLEYYQVMVRNQSLARKSVLLKNDVYNVFRNLSQNLLNPAIDVYCLRGQWDKLSSKGNDAIDFYGVVRPALVEGFKKVTIMGAHFNDSLLSMIWKQDGVRFLPNKGIKLRHSIHDIGTRRLDVWYLSERNWSKNLRDQIGCTETSIAPLLPSIQSLLGQDPFIWAANNDLEDKAVVPHFNGKATRISNISHGINEHQGTHKVMVLSALNLKPPHFKILARKFGIDPLEVKQANSHETIYQAVMRCSLRDPMATAPVTVIVPDRNLGEWLVKQFKDNGNIRLRQAPTSISKLIAQPTAPSFQGGCPPINGVAMTNAERTKASKDKKNSLREGIMALCLGLGGVHKTSYIRCSVDPSLEMSIIASRHSEPVPFVVDDNESLIAQLKVCWEYSANSKHDNILISPAKFAAKAGVETKRGLDNVISVNGVWLDQDDGTLTPQEMAKIFPNTRFVGMNSYSGNTRYFFPTTTPMTLEAYHAIWDIIVNAIEAYGYSRNPVAANFHGLDASKRPGCSMFYVPCQAKDKSKSFWLEFDGDYLDPMTMVDNYTWADPTEYAAIPAFVNPQSQQMKNLKSALVSNKGDDREMVKAQRTTKAIERWHSAPKGSGSKEFFILATTLKTLGHDIQTIRSMLNSEASFGNSPTERRDEIPAILKKIGKGRFASAANTNSLQDNQPSERLRKIIGIQTGNHP